MFSNSSKDATQQQSKSTAAKKHHSRSQPSISTPTSAATNININTSTNTSNNNTNDTFKLNDANSRGWLESSSVQANPSRSLEKKSHHRKQTKELSQKGIWECAIHQRCIDNVVQIFWEPCL